ncbi:MAG: HEAT repeat domain-containing protein [Okeania sp. SIO2F4]|uniref:NACHT domain-containing protein n=1 Tax=Okeania sp. SIO2F4 TaxID=2607790 RepID=UPI00142C79D1|nr:HEAT repeat domain-containing protein [Okeania sp. SIO2F4]NES03301.1 HEAT repeat domain-containing protein [Okeania sp. SIO2F4]
MVTQAASNENIYDAGLEAEFFILKKRIFEDRPNLLLGTSENNITEEDLDYFYTLNEAVKKYKYLLLLGEPGAGKTVALRELEKDIQTESNSLITLFVPIQKWDYPTDILTFLAKEIGEKKEYFREKIETKGILLLLDGLDELPSNVSKRSESRDAEIIDYRVQFLLKLSDFLGDFNPNNISILMTCRYRDYEEILLKNEERKNKLNYIFHGLVVLNRLKNDEIQEYLNEINQRKLNNSLNSELLWNTIQVNKDVLELIRTPFLLYVLASTLVSIFEQNPNVISQEFEQIKAVSNLEKLLDQFVIQGYIRESKKQGEKILWSLNEVKTLLGEIAVIMMSDREPDDNEILPEHFDKVLQNQPTEEFIKLTKNLYLLSEEKAANQNQTTTYKFRHLTLRDYFAFDYGSNFFKREYNLKSEKYALVIEPEQVVKAIGKIRKMQVVKLLTKLLDHSNPDVCYEAIKSLGELRTVVYFEGYKSYFPPGQVVDNSLDEFDESLIKEYFSKKEGLEINDNEAEKIYKYSGGNVWIIEQIATMFGVVSLDEILGGDSIPTRIKSKSPNEQILATTVERLLRYCVNKEDKRAVYLLAIAYHPNREFLEFMLGCENLDAKLQELDKNYPFILPEKQQLEKIHQKFTKQYLLSLRNESNLHPSENESQKIAKNLNREAANYFRDKLESLTQKLTTAKQRFNHEEFPDFLINWFYHRFWLSSKDNVKRIWNDMIPYLVEGWRYDENFVLKLLEVADEFYPEVTDEFEKDYQLFKLFRTVLKEGKDEFFLVEKLVEISDNTQEKAEWVAIALLKYCGFLYRDKQYSEVLKRSEQAQLCIPEEAKDLREKFEELLTQSLKQEKKDNSKVNPTETKSSPPISEPDSTTSKPIENQTATQSSSPINEPDSNDSACTNSQIDISRKSSETLIALFQDWRYLLEKKPLLIVTATFSIVIVAGGILAFLLFASIERIVIVTLPLYFIIFFYFKKTE